MDGSCAQKHHEALHVQRLRERVRRAGASGFAKQLRISAAGDDADGARHLRRAGFVQHGDATAVREHQVEQDPLRRGGLFDPRHRLGDGGGFRHRKALAFQQLGDRRPRRPVVLHDQHRP